MKSKIIIKLIDSLLIFTLLFVNFNIASIAKETKEPDFIEFEVRPNTEKSSNAVKTSNGLDCYKKGDIVAVDLYLKTPNSNLSYCNVGVSCSNMQTFLEIQDKIEINPELNNLKDYITSYKAANVSFNEKRFVFDSTKVNGVYLNNQKELKLATFYFKTKEPTIGIHDKLEISSKAVIMRDSKELKDVNSSYFICNSDIPTSLDTTVQKLTIAVGNEINIDSKVYTKFLDENLKEHTLQDVSYTSSNNDVLQVFADGTIRGMKQGKANITVSSKLEPKVKKEIEVEVIGRVTLVDDISRMEITNRINTLQLGKKHILNIQCTPSQTADFTNQNLKFTSSNTNVAIVDENGEITAIGKRTYYNYSICT